MPSSRLSNEAFLKTLEGLLSRDKGTVFLTEKRYIDGSEESLKVKTPPPTTATSTTTTSTSHAILLRLSDGMRVKASTVLAVGRAKSVLGSVNGLLGEAAAKRLERRGPRAKLWAERERKEIKIRREAREKAVKRAKAAAAAAAAVVSAAAPAVGSTTTSTSIPSVSSSIIPSKASSKAKYKRGKRGGQGGGKVKTAKREASKRDERIAKTS